MHGALLTAYIMLAMNAELISCKEIKRTIIIKQVKGKTVVIGLDDDQKVESNTLKDSQDATIKIVVTQDSNKSPRPDNGPDSK
ncbi:MAG: hypothetical protein ABR980_12795 [Ignavibacteriaceae bacterium]